MKKKVLWVGNSINLGNNLPYFDSSKSLSEAIINDFHADVSQVSSELFQTQFHPEV
jgi:hypothetical protein